MADTHETIADIIAEMRGMGNYQRYSGDHARVLAGRIEAAHRRELSKNMSKNGADFGQLGNAAKLREALKQVNELNDLWFDTFTLPDGATSIHDEIEDVISAALSAPPRNCDRFATVDEARKAHEVICEKYGKCHNGCPLNNEEHYSAFDCFEAWLFAQAEGGAE